MHLTFLVLLLLVNADRHIFCARLEADMISSYVSSVLKTTQSIIFACHKNELHDTAESLMQSNQLVQLIKLNGSTCKLTDILTRKNYARTSVIVNTACNGSAKLLYEASEGKYFNKTYQWLLWDVDNGDVEQLLPLELKNIGPNAQLTFVNVTHGKYTFWDVHSKGRHLKSSFEVHMVAIANASTGKERDENELIIVNDIVQLQGIKYRDNFNGLRLRVASVIDQENITTDEQIESILSRPTKDAGVAAFIKYHYELLRIVRERFNFTVNFRNARGWAGRLGATQFRLGFLGIIQRNEADIGISGSFNRINRFAEFDTIHQSWKFKGAFLYRFTPDLVLHSKSGNFLAPFEWQVWLFVALTLGAIVIVWIFIEWIHQIWYRRFERQANSAGPLINQKSSLSGITIKMIAAVCQQGMDPMPNGISCRAIIITIFIFSLVIYNYYTSSVVGGLLSSTAQGPATVEEIINSPLEVSFEDIGYYKVLFRESKSPVVAKLIIRKLSTERTANQMPIFTHIEDAVSFLKRGGFAFHCEVIDAYPEISKFFDVNEICDLRVVSGLLEVEILNWAITKNSPYTEIFKVVMCRAREIGLIRQLLQQRQPKKPECQSLYTVYPVNISGVLSAFFVLAAGIILSLLILGLEIYYEKVVVLKTRTNLFNKK